jgi:hypothetical protein
MSKAVIPPIRTIRPDHLRLCNSLVVSPADNLQTKYDWLKSDARDMEMGVLSATNKRYLMASAGNYNLTAICTGTETDSQARAKYDVVFSDANVIVMPLLENTVTFTLSDRLCFGAGTQHSLSGTASVSGNNVTLTTTAVNGYHIGSRVIISLVAGDTDLNNRWTVTALPATNQITISQTENAVTITNGADVSAGKVQSMSWSPPEIMLKTMYGIDLKSDNFSAVPTFGYNPDLSKYYCDKSQAVKPPSYSFDLTAANYTTARCTLANATTESGEYSVGGSLTLTYNGSPDTNFNCYDPITLDISNKVLYVRFKVGSADIANISNMYIRFRDTGSKTCTVSIWSSGAVAAYKEHAYGWYVCTKDLTTEAYTVDFDWANVDLIILAVNLQNTPQNGITVTFDAIRLYDRLTKGQYMLIVDDGIANMDEAIRYAISKGVTPVLAPYGSYIDNKVAGYSSIEKLQAYKRSGAVFANHSYFHSGSRYLNNGQGQIDDYFRQLWWLAKNGLLDKNSNFFATPGFYWIDNRQWDSITLGYRFGWFPSSAVYGQRIDLQNGIIYSDLSIGSASDATNLAAALLQATDNKSCVVVTCHATDQSPPDPRGGSGQIALATFKAHIDAVASAVAAGTIEVITPADE